MLFHILLRLFTISFAFYHICILAPIVIIFTCVVAASKGVQRFFARKYFEFYMFDFKGPRDLNKDKSSEWLLENLATS